MADSYFIVNEDYKLGCADSAMQNVDLSGLSVACFSVVKSNSVKSKNKKAVLSVAINVTAATGVIKTSIIDGSAVTFVSAVGVINGTSKNNTSAKQKFCLADSKITAATVAAYMGNGSVGDLTVIGTNASSGATVTDKCKVWFKDAGQNVAKAV